MPVGHRNKRARATDFDDEETDAAEQQKVKCPRSGSASGEAAMPVEVEDEVGLHDGGLCGR